MPEIIHTALLEVSAQLFTGKFAQSSLPSTVYLGIRDDTPGATDTLTTVSGHEIGATSAGGYARVAITRNDTNLVDAAAGTGWEWTISNTSWSFTGTPNPNGGTHFFLTDQAAGYSGNLYGSYPINPAAVSGTITVQSNSGTNSLTVSTAVAGDLNNTDWVYVGTVGTNANQERIQLSNANSATGVLTTATNLANTHVIGEPLYRDCVVRIYGSGITEQCSTLVTNYLQG